MHFSKEVCPPVHQKYLVQRLLVFNCAALFGNFMNEIQSTLKPCKSELGKPISRRGDLDCKFVDMCFFPKIYLIFEMPIFDHKEISNRGISLLHKSLNCTFLTCFSISLKMLLEGNNPALTCYIVSKLVHFLTKRSI